MKPTTSAHPVPTIKYEAEYPYSILTVVKVGIAALVCLFAISGYLIVKNDRLQSRLDVYQAKVYHGLTVLNFDCDNEEEDEADAIYNNWSRNGWFIPYQSHYNLYRTTFHKSINRCGLHVTVDLADVVSEEEEDGDCEDDCECKEEEEECEEETCC